MWTTLIAAQVNRLLCGHDNALPAKKPKCTLKSRLEHPFELTYLFSKNILQILLFSLVSWFVKGNFIKRNSFSSKIACSNSLQMNFAVDFPNPNCNPQFLYWARRHSARPTLSLTLIENRTLVCCFCKFILSRLSIQMFLGRLWNVPPT